MNRGYQIEFCKKCKNQKFDLKRGIICNLTNQKADFDIECKEFVVDKTKVTDKASFKRNEINKNRIDLKKYGESFWLIFLGVGFFLWTRGNVENYSPANTTFVKGVLSEAPREGSQGGDYDYVAIELKGHKDTYRFSKCSLSDKIQEKVSKLVAGDSVYLYTKKNWSTKSINLKPKSTKSYSICDARSPKYGHFVKFSGYNNCTHWEKNTFFPILSGILVFFGLLGLRKILRKSE